MTDNERRVRAAELMGWKRPRGFAEWGEGSRWRDVREYEDIHMGDIVAWRNTKTGDRLTAEEYDERSCWKTPNGSYIRCPPDYPHNMNAAMELAEFARKKRGLNFALERDENDATYFALLYDGNADIWAGGKDEGPARAITDAFIAAMCDQISE